MATSDVIGLLFSLLSIYLIWAYIKHKRIAAVHSNRSHYFDGLQFSAEEYYVLVEDIVRKYAMPEVKISRVEHYEKYSLSNRRQYLRIERRSDIFDICAAPFGTGFFVSYWHGEPQRRIRDLALKTPFLSTAVSGWQGSTFYLLDTANMFKLCVKDSITEAIDQITSNKGIRGLSEAERIAFSV
jgi:hypothetical protein